MSPIAYLRRMAKPTGRRRAGHPQTAPEFVPIDSMLRPTEAMASDVAYCPAEETERLHAFLRTGGRVCWTCRTVTTDPTPPGGAE